MGLPAFLGVGGLEALEIEFGNIKSPDLAQEELDILQQMIHPDNQAELVLPCRHHTQTRPSHRPRELLLPRNPKAPRRLRASKKQLHLRLQRRALGASAPSQSLTWRRSRLRQLRLATRRLLVSQPWVSTSPCSRARRARRMTNLARSWTT
jgi:hypothetical protein